MYAWPSKSGADFSRGSAHPATRPRILATHPRRFANRAPPAPVAARANGANGVPSAPFARSGTAPRSGLLAARVDGGKKKGRERKPGPSLPVPTPGAPQGMVLSYQ